MKIDVEAAKKKVAEREKSKAENQKKIEELQK